ncbi:DUF6998 domain-containing protein [Brucella pituitosa]|uniref:DUF6998 domain-containing protein n=1 Tax=Brucella pituitosa TaxID=571256 RepID=UPI003C76F8C5
MTTFKLPPQVIDLIEARNKLKAHYDTVLKENGSGISLRFTLDGNLIGDLGEAIAVDLFDIRLVETRSTEGIDGYTPDGKTVQVKATGTGRGPAFRQTETRADCLLFFELDFESATGTVVYNGPEHYAISMLPPVFSNQRMLTKGQIRSANASVKEHERIPRIKK